MFSLPDEAGTNKSKNFLFIKIKLENNTGT